MAYRNKNELLDIEGDLIGWDDESDGTMNPASV